MDYKFQEEYYQRFTELKRLILVSFMDAYSLNAFESYNKLIIQNERFPLKSVHYVFQHFCELLKNDLGLSIWKVYSDSNPRANTLNKLHSFLYKNMAKNNLSLCFPKMSLPSKLSNQISKLETLRKQYLAHNDCLISDISIDLTDLIAIIEELRKKLNAMCFSHIDVRVSEITDKDLSDLRFITTLGLNSIILCSTVTPNESKKTFLK